MKGKYIYEVYLHFSKGVKNWANSSFLSFPPLFLAVSFLKIREPSNTAYMPTGREL